MATLGQWLNGKWLSTVTYIHGDNQLAAELAVDIAKQRLSNLNRLELKVCNSLEEASTELYQYLLDSYNVNKMVIVRGVSQREDYSRILEWDKIRNRQFPDTYLVLVSSEYSVKADKAPLSAFKDLSIVSCSNVTDSAIASWAAKALNHTGPTVKAMVDKCGGDLSSVKDAVKILKAADIGPTVDNVAVVTEGRNEGSLVDSIVRVDKREALRALTYVAPSDLLPSVRKLEMLVTALSRLEELKRRKATHSEISGHKEIPQFVVARYSDVAKFYDIKTAHGRFKLLATAESALKQGITEGVVEMLILAW